MDALGRGLLKEFPNPDRIGCPGVEVLKKIASHEMPLSEAEKWLDHLGSCSPCYRDFREFQAAYRRRRSRTLLAVAASILIVACLAGWAMFLRQKETSGAQTAEVNLRDRSIPRGTEPNANEAPLEVSRAATRWDIYLPLGSTEGIYEVRVSRPSSEVVVVATGTAFSKDGVVGLRVELMLSSVSSGRYTLQIRKRGAEWNSYPLLLR